MRAYVAGEGVSGKRFRRDRPQRISFAKSEIILRQWRLRRAFKCQYGSKIRVYKQHRACLLFA